MCLLVEEETITDNSLTKGSHLNLISLDPAAPGREQGGRRTDGAHPRVPLSGPHQCGLCTQVARA